jgi:hypothetical protein
MTSYGLAMWLDTARRGRIAGATRDIGGIERHRPLSPRMAPCRAVSARSALPHGAIRPEPAVLGTGSIDSCVAVSYMDHGETI